MTRFADLDPFEARRAKLQAWRDLGIDPFPAALPEHSRVVEVREHGNSLGEALGPQAAVAGRLKSLRGQGALLFADLYDETGKLQVLFKQDSLSPELFERLELLDIGDFIWASGQLFVSKRGELTLEVQDWLPAAKSLRPLPDLWKGLQDVEARQRQRYAELIVSDSAQERFRNRSKLVQAIRQQMHQAGFTEVETPVLEHIPGGADAEPFITHHNALDTDFYLRISLELHLKRLIVGGFDRVFEIGKVFRNEGMSPQHLQEFTMFEFYWAYASYRDLIPFVRRLYQDLVQELFDSLQIERGEHTLDFSGEWKEVHYTDLLQEYAGVNLLEASDDDLVQHIVDHDLKTGGGANQAAKPEELKKLGRGRLTDLLYKKTVRPFLIQPHIITDFPVEFSPLAKRRTDEPRLTERMVVVVDGVEIGNGFSELNDPLDQRERLEEQEKLRLAGDPEAQRLDQDFLRALEYGMPPTTGFGVSIDRLMAILFGIDSVRETVLFPTMRPEKHD